MLSVLVFGVTGNTPHAFALHSLLDVVVLPERRSLLEMIGVILGLLWLFLLESQSSSHDRFCVSR